MRKAARLGFIVSFILLVFLSSCNEDPLGPDGSNTSPASGSIIIEADPDSIAADWQLVGPGYFNAHGSGDSTLTLLAAGEYTLSWANVSGWISPDPRQPSATLLEDGALLFLGEYEQLVSHSVGRIQIVPQPNLATIPWQLELPDGLWMNSEGYSLLEGMPLGEYTLIWGDHPGWQSPLDNPQTEALASEGQTLTFVGEYLGLGTITIDTEPDHLEAPWRLENSPEGEILAFGYGDSILNGFEYGEYMVTWLPVEDWEPPASDLGWLDPGSTLPLGGTYTEILPSGTIAIEILPDGIHAPWRLTGPNGIELSSEGETIIEDAPTGDYMITWLQGDFHNPPVIDTQTLSLYDGQTIVFLATYTDRPPTDWIGIYLDPEGTIREFSMPQGEFVTAYLLAHIPSFEGGITAAVFRVEGWIGNPGLPDGFAFLDWTTPLVIGDPEIGASVAWSEPQFGDGNDNVLLATLTLYSEQGTWPDPNTMLRVVREGYYDHVILVDEDFWEYPVGGDSCVVNPSGLH